MDNVTYDELNLTPVDNDETYSRLRTTQTKIKPSNELQRRADTDQTATKEVQQNHLSNKTKFNTVMIIMIVILLLITLMSIALSVTTLNRLASEQSKMLSQLENTNIDITHQFDTLGKNLSQNILHVETQLITAQGNISLQLDTKLENFASLLTQYLNIQIQMHCGPGLWHRLAYLNMTDPSQRCPFAWREYNNNTGRVRACGRPENSSGSCLATPYSTCRQYSRVCGRVVGYQFVSPDGFERHGSNGIDLDGINITCGAKRSHIWSYVAGYTQNTSSESAAKCPCFGQGIGPPPSVGNNYYCESGNPDNLHMENRLYFEDPLWDGQQCEGTCCNRTMSPPWFSVQLPAPTTDVIEVSICCDQDTNDEDVLVELIEIYVQ